MQSLIGGRYQVGNRLGSFENRVDYLGFDRQMHRMVLLQIYGPTGHASKETRQKLTEIATVAKAAAGRNILSVFDVVQNRQELVLVREYMPSESLRQIIDAEGPFHPDDVAALIDQLAAGLSATRKAGLQFPDLTPAVVSVDQAGVARIDPANATLVSGNERPSQLTGLQLAPELVTGETIDQRSEVFALATIAFEMLTGQLPFPDHKTDLLQTDWVNPESPSLITPGLDPRIDPVVLAGLSYEPDDRQATPARLATELGNWNASPIQLRAVPRQSPQPVPTVLPYDFAEAESGSEYHLADQDSESVDSDDQGWRIDATTSANWPLLLVSGLLLTGLIVAIVWGTRHLLADDPPPSSATASVVAAASTPTSGPVESAVVPEVVGESVQDARTSLEAAGFRMLVVGESPNSVQDRVGSQSPSSGSEIAKGSEVQVQIAADQPIDLASLGIEGQPADLATETLQSMGLVVTLDEETSTDVPEGQVIRTEPDGVVEQGDNITLVVSKGNSVQIPTSIQGASLNEAEKTLTDLGITVSNTIPVSAATIESFGIDLEAAGITNQSVVGIQDGASGFGEWVAPGTSVTLVYYDQSLDPATPTP